MKITDVSTWYLRQPSIQNRTDSSQDTLVVVVSTDAGITGYGEVDSSPEVVRAVIEAGTSHTLVNGLRGILLNQDPMETSVLWDLMYRRTLYYGRQGPVIHAMAGVDLALWDIKGKALGQPVHRLLGGAFRKELPAYASFMFGLTPQETARRAAVARDAGFGAVKFGWEPFGQDPALDVQLVAAVRAEIGPDRNFMLDAGLAWDSRTAVRRCKILEPYGMFWLEEPLPPDDLDGYARLAAAVDIPLAAGEEECTVAGFERLMDQGHVSIVQVDLTRVGLTQAMTIAAMAQRRGLKVCNHNFTTEINVAASLHFLAAVPNALYLEYCCEDTPLRQGISRNPVPIIDGKAAVPETPGLGVEINMETVERYAVRA